MFSKNDLYKRKEKITDSGKTSGIKDSKRKMA
jgi:hypothetical protein